jgi:hypothetical protein
MLLQKALELAGEALFARSPRQNRERTGESAPPPPPGGPTPWASWPRPRCAPGSRRPEGDPDPNHRTGRPLPGHPPRLRGDVRGRPRRRPERAALRPDALLPPQPGTAWPATPPGWWYGRRRTGPPSTWGAGAGSFLPPSGGPWIFGTAGVAFRDAETGSATPTTSCPGRTVGPPTSRTSSSSAAATTVSSTREASAWNAATTAGSVRWRVRRPLRGPRRPRGAGRASSPASPRRRSGRGRREGRGGAGWRRNEPHPRRRRSPGAPHPRKDQRPPLGRDPPRPRLRPLGSLASAREGGHSASGGGLHGTARVSRKTPPSSEVTAWGVPAPSARSSPTWTS